MRLCSLVVLLVLGMSAALMAQPPADDYQQDEFPQRPAPDWVRMVDQGTGNPALQGLQTPAGIRVEIVAQEPVVKDPVGMAFSPDGSAYVLEWRKAESARHMRYEVTFQDGSKGVVNRMKKSTFDEMKRLTDSNGDGRYDRATVVMDDLEIPSSMTFYRGWVYLPSIGHVLRRRQSKPDGAWDIEEEIVRGLCGFHHHQASGVAIGHDGWIYVSSGDDDNRAEGSDGSRATVLRTGAVFRMRPDGSKVREFARGFRNPYREVAFDDYYNMFHVDNDQEDGSKFQGVRLMHIQEGDDFGWRLYEGAVCCRTDFVRGAVFGEKPGKVPSMLKTGRGSPAGLLIYNGVAFPDFFRGLLIYPDVYRRLVRAYQIERRGSTFAVTHQFVLMQSEDPLFRPCQAIQGPDGAIYIVDWRTDSGGAGRLWGDDQHGRIYRLTWSGTEQAPAIAAGSLDAWAPIAAAQDQALWKLLDSRDVEIRRRAQQELVRRGEAHRASFIAVALNKKRPLPARVLGLGAACQFYDETVAQMLFKLAEEPHFELRRLAYQAIGRHTPPSRIEAAAALQRLVTAKALEDKHPAVQRAVGLAIGDLIRQSGATASAEEALTQLIAARIAAPGEDAHLLDGLIRGFERAGQLGIERLVELLESDQPETRSLGVRCVQALRSRDAAAVLDRALVKDRLAKLSDIHKAAVIATYRHILVEPPISSVAIGKYIAAHPRAADAVQLAALETMALVGGADEATMAEVAERLLESEDPQARLAVIRSIGEARLTSFAQTLAAALRETTRSQEERREIVGALAKLRSRYLPFVSERTAPGVELVVDDLAEIAGDTGSGAIRGDVLGLLAQVDFARAEPIARKMLSSGDTASVQAAIRVLSARADWAKRIASQFVEGRIDRSLLADVAEALRRHREKDQSGEIAGLIAKVFQGGLLVSLEPDEVQRVEKLIASQGDPGRGRQVYFDKRTRCSACHKLEGVGGQIGPDLSKIWKTHPVAKILESMIQPSKEIKEGYATWQVVTDSGQVYSGLKIADQAKEIVLRDASGKDIRLQAGEIDEKIQSKQSLMPEGVISQLSYQELIDLVAFLKSRAEQEKLRQQEQARKGE